MRCNISQMWLDAPPALYCIYCMCIQLPGRHLSGACAYEIECIIQYKYGSSLVRGPKQFHRMNYKNVIL